MARRVGAGVPEHLGAHGVGPQRRQGLVVHVVGYVHRHGDRVDPQVAETGQGALKSARQRGGRHAGQPAGGRAPQPEGLDHDVAHPISPRTSRNCRSRREPRPVSMSADLTMVRIVSSSSMVALPTASGSSAAAATSSSPWARWAAVM